VLGAWLVETYKGTFASEIGKGGIDGLIKKLHDRNKQLANKPLKSAAKVNMAESEIPCFRWTP
jgi:phospholipid transport system substrate-binding protein